ncbi:MULTISPECIES: MIP/aquaporin family protein [Zobellia]|uniref:Glycerol uptake facilitator protein n=1 Tax=Zobellia galactanivorans (strain DSM 12802 / CCUG 47099 / CIP 106680 / NCIMB 13871 / Dsij) TaxID=63186 RepID=G0LCN8_ZOBGA|nr:MULTISPECIES: MIP/aquaporin family protein [Zobellia]MDO6519719.1 MIP/aquaporin family protein [Zobellia uliginosa]OWW25247.1 aquaporin [Zobellia sp. OII3]CAZ97061.1 Glycerol uptake facilitator protein [Zobellia galactanivorans]
MIVYLYEFIGTALLILIGNGVVANLVLKGTKGPDTGWTGISLAWGIAVFIGVYVSADVSHAHINPAVTLALAVAGKFSWQLVPGYMLAQILGAMMGNFMVWLSYKKHYDATEDQGAILATFCTAPAIRSPFWNFVTEAIGTFVLVFGVFFIAGGTFGDEPISLGSLDALPVALLVMGIGFGLGGPTGYAINPARDFGPRLLHAILPLKGKGSSDWGYAWIPIVAPLCGAVVAALTYLAIAV